MINTCKFNPCCGNMRDCNPPEQPFGFRNYLQEPVMPPEIKNPESYCPAADREGVKHTLRWRSDHHAVCRLCGGVYLKP